MAYLISSSCTLFPAMLFVDAVPWGANGMFFFRPWSSLSPRMGIMGRTMGIICCFVAVGRQSGYKPQLSTGMDTAPARWFGTKILQNREKVSIWGFPPTSPSQYVLFLFISFYQPSQMSLSRTPRPVYTVKPWNWCYWVFLCKECLDLVLKLLLAVLGHTITRHIIGILCVR